MAVHLPDGSRVRREPHARFCERLEVKSLRPTLPPVDVLAPGTGKTKTGRLWVYLRDERPHAGDAPPAVLI
jgi:hypothetical protein